MAAGQGQAAHQPQPGTLPAPQQQLLQQLATGNQTVTVPQFTAQLQVR